MGVLWHPCLESQGCHLIPHSYLLSCFSPQSSSSSCHVIFLPMVHSLHARSIRLHGIQYFSCVECCHAPPLQTVVCSSGLCLLTGFFLLPTCDDPLMLGPVSSSSTPPPPCTGPGVQERKKISMSRCAQVHHSL